MRQTSSLGAEYKRVSCFEMGVRVTLPSLGGAGKHASGLHRARKPIEAWIVSHAGPLGVIQSCAPQLLVIQVESERSDEMKMTSYVRAQSHHVAGVGWYLGLI